MKLREERESVILILGSLKRREIFIEILYCLLDIWNHYVNICENSKPRLTQQHGWVGFSDFASITSTARSLLGSSHSFV